MKPVSVVIPAMPMPTPTIAVSSGIPAAMSEPKVITSTTRATTTPIASADPPGGPASDRASPPMAVVIPAASAVVLTLVRASVSAVVSSTGVTL